MHTWIVHNVVKRCSKQRTTLFKTTLCNGCTTLCKQRRRGMYLNFWPRLYPKDILYHFHPLVGREPGWGKKVKKNTTQSTHSTGKEVLNGFLGFPNRVRAWSSITILPYPFPSPASPRSPGRCTVRTNVTLDGKPQLILLFPSDQTAGVMVRSTEKYRKVEQRTSSPLK